jgi:hypothetical protein
MNATSELTHEQQAPERLSDHAIYKPNSRGTGGVMRFGLNLAKGAVFLDAAMQSGDKQFDWENKITMKWGLNDLGSALAALQRRMPEAKLFHKTNLANSAFDLVRQDDPQRAPYTMSLSRQDAATKEVRKVSIPLTHAEAAVLSIVLETAVARLVGW